MLVVLVGRRLPIGTRSLGRVSRRGLLLLLLGRWLVPLLLAVARLLGLVARLLLAICCWLRVAALVVTSWLAVGVVTGRNKDRAISKNDECVLVEFTYLAS